MARARSHKRSGGFFSNLFRALFSGDSPCQAESGRKRRGATHRRLRFEGCEQRQLLAVDVVWTAGAPGTLTLTSDAADDAVSVIGTSSYVDVYVGGLFQARLTGANSSNVGTINFTGGGGNDALTIQNIQPAGGVTIGLTDVGTLSMLKGSAANVTSNAGLILGKSDLSGALGVNITGAGNLTQSGPVVVGGATSLSVTAANDITLTQAKNNFNSVAVTAANNVSLVDVNSLDLAGLTVSGNLSVQASISSSSRGTLSQTGVITLNSAGNASTTLAVGRASTITLTDAGNVLHRGTGSVAVTSGGTVSITNLGDTNLGSSNVTGNLTVTAVQNAGDGDITQTAGSAVVVGKVATFVANAAEDITLSEPANNFGTVVVTSGLNVDLQDVNAIAFGASTISGNLLVEAGGQITQKGALTVGDDTTLNAGSANNITLSNAGNNFGNAAADSLAITGRNVTVRNADGLYLGASTISGTFSLTTGGAIAQDGATVLNVAGKTTLAAGAANSITLSNANLLSEVAVTSGLNVAITDTDGGLALGKSRISGTLGITATAAGATGALTQTGAVVVTGATTLDVGAGDDITLTTSSNNFSSVAVTTGRNVSLADTNALQLGASTISGNLSVTARGNVSKTAAATAVSVAGATSVSVGRANSITLAGTNTTFTGAVSVTGGTVELSNTTATVFDTTDVKNNLTVTSTAGAVSQVAGGGAMVVGRTATFTATGQTVTLNNAANNFFVVSVVGAAVTLVDVDAIALGASTVTGALSVTAGKAISQTGALTVSNAATAFIAGPTAKDSIVLNNSGNNFQAAGANGVSLTAGGNVVLVDSNAIQLGASTVGGTLSVTSGGAAGDNITQSGALDITGKTTLAAGGGNVTLTTAANDFSVVSVTSGNVVQITDGGAVTLGLCAIDGNLTVIAGGAIDQSDSVVAGATTTLTATGFDITMTLDGNDFDVLVLSADNVSIAVSDANASGLVLGGAAASTVTGDLAVTTDCDITDGGAMTVSGNTTLAVGTGHNIALAAGDDNFYQVAVESAYDVALADTSALILGTSSISHSLIVDTAGTVSQDGALSAATVDVTSAGGDVTLDEVENSITSTINASGANVTIVNNTDTDLGAVTAGANLVVDAVGQITDSGTITVTGTSSFTARTSSAYNDIALDALGSDLGTALSLAGHTVTVANNNVAAMPTLTIGNATATGDLTITLSGAAQSFTNTPGSNMSIDGKTTIRSIGGGATVIDLFYAGCKFGDWTFPDPTDNPTSDLYLEAATVNLNG